MKKQIQAYTLEIKNLLASDNADTDWQDIIAKHLIKIGFYQHERLIHLIVTVTFALLEIISVVASIALCNAGMLLLSGAVMILLIPYIAHYYFLENSVQELYIIYDELLKKVEE